MQKKDGCLQEKRHSSVVNFYCRWANSTSNDLCNNGNNPLCNNPYTPFPDMFLGGNETFDGLGTWEWKRSNTTYTPPPTATYYRFGIGLRGNTTGTFWADAVQVEYGSTLTNFIDSAWTNGKFGSALEFDGKNDYVEVPYSDNLDITDAITLSAWVYPNSLSDWASIIERDQQAGYKLGFLNNNVTFTLYGLWDSFSIGTIPLNQWSHIAATYDRQNVKIYINGNLDNTIPHTDQIGIGTSPLDIGRRRTINFDYFNGIIDEVRIWNRALNSTEINAEMNKG